MRDLLILVADVNIEKVIRKMLEQSEKLGISEIDYEIYIHPEHDPGCCTNSATFIRSFYQEYRHAMVVFDHEGCGRESKSPSELEMSLYDELASVDGMIAHRSLSSTLNWKIGSGVIRPILNQYLVGRRRLCDCDTLCRQEVDGLQDSQNRKSQKNWCEKC